MRRGFTLIELLTVIAIIAILAGVLIPSLVRARSSTEKVEAKNMINAIEMAIEHFKLDYNQHPWDPLAGPGSMADVIRELMPDDPRITAGLVPEHNKKGRSYLRSIKKKYIKDGTLVDPWRQEYMIEFSVTEQKMTIWSAGSNELDETSDDDEVYGDDITNL